MNRLASLVAAVLLVGLGLATPGCRNPQPPAPPQLDASKFPEIAAAIESFIEKKQMPGAAFWLERNGATYHKAYGHRTLAAASEAMDETTLFDAASLTKVIATTPSIMLLIEQGKVDVDAPVSRYIPEFKGGGKEAITVRHLMTHTSGLIAGLPATPAWSGYDKAISLACALKVTHPPGTFFRYSDPNYILVGEIVHRVSGKPLNEFAAEKVFGPLGMKDSGYLPLKRFPASRMAPTEKIAGKALQGEVHDPTSRRMGGVAGHAGLFTTTADLARFARMMVNMGELDGVRLFKPETVRLMTSVQSPAGVLDRRGLGWDVDSAYSRPRGTVFPVGSYGHTGFTGCIFWVDPFSKAFYVFLSNRVHPDGNGNILPLYGTLGTLSAQSAAGFDFSKVSGALQSRGRADTNKPSLNGIDVLKRDGFAPLKGKKVALITNHTGRDQEGNSTIDLLFKAPGVKLAMLFGPEHGIRGEVDEKVGDSVDQKTGLKVYSLYPESPKRPAGMSEADYTKLAMESRKPRQDLLKQVDVVVFDIQDIGCRFYTYVSTMGGAMEAAARAGIEIMVLDRVNPIGGRTVEGPVQTRFQSFIGYHTLPVRHGMTVGELARMFNEELGYKAKLTVVPVENWTRGMWFDETKQPWINPSPNIRNLDQAALYPGIGLVEFNPVSVGRGTETPFEVVGAPWIDAAVLAKELTALNLAGVKFAVTSFTPTSSVHAKKLCHGVKMTVTDRELLRPVDIGIGLATTLQRLYPKDFNLPKFETLVGNKDATAGIKDGLSLPEFHAAWSPQLKGFLERRERYLIYR